MRFAGIYFILISIIFIYEYTIINAIFENQSYLLNDSSQDLENFLNRVSQQLETLKFCGIIQLFLLLNAGLALLERSRSIRKELDTINQKLEKLNKEN
jgi:hypothetical protein